MDDEQLDPDIAVQWEEEISATLADGSPEECKAVAAAAAARLETLLPEPDAYGYSQRKLVTAEHRQLLEDIASGEAFTGS